MKVIVLLSAAALGLAGCSTQTHETAGGGRGGGFALANVAVSTPDPDRLAKWYADALGFRVGQRARGVEGVELLMIERDGVVLDLIKVPNQRPAPAPVDPPRHLETPGFRNLVFWVDDLRAADARLKSRGVRLVWESKYIDGIGTANTAFHDPDGNLVALWQRRPAPPGTAATRPAGSSGRGLDSVAVFNTAVSVPDVDAAVEWYRRVLGFREVSRTSLANGASFAMVERNGVVVEFLHVAGQRPPVPGMDADPPEHIRLLGVKNICWWVDGMDATLAELDRHGVEYVWRARHLPEVDAVVTMIRDNNRNLVTMWERRGAVWESLGRP